MQRWNQLTLAVAALGAGLLMLVAGVVSLRLLRCPHRKMSWPIRQNGHAYQVCLDCGIKRLFDETQFRAYGRYSHDLDQLLSPPQH
ncbi:MAG: hypothetical protein WA188_19735 [Terriglobales bacterium]